MAQTFWSDVTGKKITVGNLVSALPAYFYSTSSVVNVGGSTEYLSASSTSPSAALTFTAPSNSSATVTVGVKGKFSDGKYTNEVTDTITIKRALSSLSYSTSSTPIYTKGPSGSITLSPDNVNVYGWSTSAADISLSYSTGAISTTKVSGSNKWDVSSIASLDQGESSKVYPITFSTSAGKYSTAAKSVTAGIEVRQQVEGITTSKTSIDVYAGENFSFTYTCQPTWAYSDCKKVQVFGTNGNTPVTFGSNTPVTSATVSNGTISGTTSASITGAITLTVIAANQPSSTSTEVTVNVIAKSAASITASPTSVTMNTGGSATVTFTPTGCTLNAPTSGDTSKITVSNTKSGNNYSTVVNGVAATTGTNISCTGAASTGYTTPSTKTVSVVVKDITMTIS